MEYVKDTKKKKMKKRKREKKKERKQDSMWRVNTPIEKN
jgi:hypothetical protein